MKEGVLDILIYLFENYFDAETDDGFEPDRETLKLELEKAGFPGTEVERALCWLEELAADPWNGIKQFALAFVATLFVPVVLDLLGKSLMKDVADGTWGLLFVFFSYCFIVATFGAGFIFPVMGGFERAIRTWQDRGKWG